MDLLNQITHNQSPVIRGFNLSVESDFIKVPARQLGTTLALFYFNTQNVVKNHILQFFPYFFVQFRGTKT